MAMIESSADHEQTESPRPRRAPGPRGVPLFGNTLGAWKDVLKLMFQSWQAHGDIVRFKFGPYDYLFINDPDAIRHVLVDNNKNYTKSRNYHGLKLVLGEGLVTSEGDHWRRQRKLAQPAFHRDRLASFAQTMVADTSALLDRWAAKDGEVMDVHAEMMRLTFRIVGRTLFSTDVEGESERIGPAITVAMHHANDYAESLVRIPPWVPTPGNFRFKRAMRDLDELVLRIIGERRAAKGAGDASPSLAAGPHDLLSMLMDARDEETRAQMTDRQLRDEVLTLVLAGHETTANLLTWTWYLLSKHPDAARRVYAEVRAVLGERKPALEDLPKLTYTTMVINESMRLLPPVWAFERQAIAADTLGGFDVPAGAIVGIAPYCLHRHPRYWENPEGFDPERFAQGRGEGRPRYAYLPFGGGPRQCIGNGFAMMEAQIILAMIAQRHRLELVAGHPVELEPTVTLRPKHGMRMTLRAQTQT